MMSLENNKKDGALCADNSECQSGYCRNLPKNYNLDLPEVSGTCGRGLLYDTCHHRDDCSKKLTCKLFKSYTGFATGRCEVPKCYPSHSKARQQEECEPYGEPCVCRSYIEHSGVCARSSVGEGCTQNSDCLGALRCEIPESRRGKWCPGICRDDADKWLKTQDLEYDDKKKVSY